MWVFSETNFVSSAASIVHGTLQQLARLQWILEVNTEQKVAFVEANTTNSKSFAESLWIHTQPLSLPWYFKGRWKKNIQEAVGVWCHCTLTCPYVSHCQNRKLVRMSDFPAGSHYVYICVFMLLYRFVPRQLPLTLSVALPILAP